MFLGLQWYTWLILILFTIIGLWEIAKATHKPTKRRRDEQDRE